MASLRELPRKRESEIGRPPRRMSELEQLISSALRDAHVARDKGSHTVSREATSCVGALRHIKSLPLDSRRISDSDAFCSLLFLAKNDNPKIRSEARSVLTHLRNIMSGIHRDGFSGSSSSSCLSSRNEGSPNKKKTTPIRRRTESLRNAKDSVGKKKKTSTLADTQKKISNQNDKTEAEKNNGGSVNSRSIPKAGDDTQQQKKKMETTTTEYMKVYETLKEAHEAVKKRSSLTAEESRRCVVALKGLFVVPQAVTRDLLVATDAGLRMQSLNEHRDPGVQSMAASLLEHWLLLIYHSS